MTHSGTTRRRLLLAGTTALLAGVAGCAADGVLDDEPTATPTPTAEGTSTTASTSTPEPTTTAEPTSTAEPVTPHGDAHFHGTLRLEIDGTVYRFGDKPRNMEEATGNPHFHFHDDGSADRWHVHSEGVTLGYAADAMPEFELSATSVTYHGHSYREEWPGTSVGVTVNGAPLEDPRSYLLREGDAVLVTVETDRPTPTPTTGNGTTTAGGNGTDEGAD